MHFATRDFILLPTYLHGNQSYIVNLKFIVSLATLHFMYDTVSDGFEAEIDDWTHLMFTFVRH